MTNKYADMPVIQVGIMSGGRISFKLNGGYTEKKKTIPLEGDLVARTDKAQIVVENGKGEIFSGREFVFYPDNQYDGSFTLHEVTIGIGFHWEKKESQTFRGALKLIITGAQISAINILPVENYLLSVISSEMSATSSLEMLKAHAVISRSWLLAQIEKKQGIFNNDMNQLLPSCNDEEIIKWYDREDHEQFDVCADDHCQRYQGITRASTNIVKSAVEQTSGEVLTFQNKLCDARFSKCCGGVTELFENAWEPVNHPYLQKVYDGSDNNITIDLTNEEQAKKWIMTKPDAFCNTADRNVLFQVLNDYDRTTQDFYRWKIEYSGEELQQLIKQKSGIDFGDIEEMVPLERGVSGRIIRLRIIGSKKSMVIGKELEIRKTLSPTHLYSSAFVVEKLKQDNQLKFILHGAGWGHGVGLCQIGAAVMGAKGYSYKDILMHYYRGAIITKQY